MTENLYKSPTVEAAAEKPDSSRWTNSSVFGLVMLVICVLPAAIAVVVVAVVNTAGAIMSR